MINKIMPLSKLVLGTIFVVPILLTISHHYILANNANGPPPIDFGTGTMFDGIASRYDFINRILAFGMDVKWRQVMTSTVHDMLVSVTTKNDDASSSSYRLLDVATGTADVALQLASQFVDLDVDGSSSSSTTDQVHILGLDPSKNMLKFGRTKIHEQELDNVITLEEADARDLSRYYPTSEDDGYYYDAATIAFGIRNVVPNRETALCEIHKLLHKPNNNNGILAILEFSEPTFHEFGIMGWITRFMIQHVVPKVGALISGGAKREYQHLQNSIQEFPTPTEFQYQLQHLQCDVLSFSSDNADGDLIGYFDMLPIKHMNFGSVQLYVGRAKTKLRTTSTTISNSNHEEQPQQMDETEDTITNEDELPEPVMEGEDNEGGSESDAEGSGAREAEGESQQEQAHHVEDEAETAETEETTEQHETGPTDNNNSGSSGDPVLPPITTHNHVDVGEPTELHTAAAQGDVQWCLKVLSVQPQLVRARDPNGWEPLHEGGRSGSIDTVRTLLEYGADINARTGGDGMGGTVLYWALTSIGEDHPVITFLKEQGAINLSPGDQDEEEL